MPPTKRRTALKDKNNDERSSKISGMQADLLNWEDGAVTERKMLEAEADSAKQRVLDHYDRVLDNLTEHELEMTVSDFIEHILNSKSEEIESEIQPDVDGLIEEMNDMDSESGGTKAKKTGARKRKKATASRTTKKNKKPSALSLQTPSVMPGGMKDTPFMTPLVRSRLLEATPLTTARMATEADLLRGCQTRIQLVSHSGSPIILPVDNVMLARELQRRCLDDYMKVGEEWKKCVD